MFRRRITPFLALLGVLCILTLCEANYSATCSSSSETTLKPSEDGVRGRYILRWCTEVTEKDTLWNLELLYNRKNTKACSVFKLLDTHSSKSEEINFNNFNCSHVCLSTELDLIFSTCYVIQNWFPSQGSMRHITRLNITNEYTIDTFKNSMFEAVKVIHEDYVTVTFLLDNIPATDYDMELCVWANNTHIGEWSCSHIEANCSAAVSRRRNEIACRAPAAPGRYDLRLTHRAAWVRGYGHHKRSAHHAYEVRKAAPLSREEAGASWPVALGAALGAAGGAALLALLAARLAQRQRWRRQVKKAWLRRFQHSTGDNAAVGGCGGGGGGCGGDGGGGCCGGGGAILLLYGRDGPSAEPVLRALKALLATVADRVYDLHDPDTIAEAAPDVVGWARRLLAPPPPPGRAAPPPARAVLLSSPALLLHAPSATEGAVLYASPSPADALLPLLLAALRDDYRAVHIALLEDLPVEVMPHKVPYTRYVLPRHVDTLLRDLSCPLHPPPPPTPPPPLTPLNPPPTHPQPLLQHTQETKHPNLLIENNFLQETNSPTDSEHLKSDLAVAIKDFVKYVNENPGYMMQQFTYYRYLFESVG